MMKKLALVSAISAALLTPTLASAESTLAFGPATSTTARLNFQITIPSILSLRVGTVGATLDTIAFAPTQANLGTGPIPGTGGDVPLIPGAVNVRVIANNVPNGVTLSSTATPITVSGTTIPWSDITVTTTPGTPGATASSLTDHPAFPANGAIVAWSLPTTAASSRVVNAQGTWTYNFANNTVYPAGISNVGVVTYTATAAP